MRHSAISSIALSALVILAIASPPVRAQTSPDSFEAQQAQKADSIPPAGSLAAVLDGFLEIYAGNTLSWRKNITLFGVDEPVSLPPGFQKKQSSLGWFIFLPKRTGDLTPEERRSIQRDPRFLQYVSMLRTRTDAPTGNADGKAAPASLSDLSQAMNPPPALSRADLFARLRLQHALPPAPVLFSMDAGELLAPGPMLISIQARKND